MQILIIDDDQVDYLATSKMLLKAFPSEDLCMDWIQNPRDIDYLSLFRKFDVCLIDQNLGSILGLNIIQDMQRAGCTTPLILLTGSINEETDHKAAEFGATDYLQKNDVTPTLLNRSIRFAIAQKKHEKKLVKFAYTDGLTGISNRKRFDEFTETNLSWARRNHSSIGMILIDLDDFKLVNDTYGHQAGDSLLQHVAYRLTSVVRKTDIVARLGGDEFGIVLTMLQDLKDIELILSKIEAVFNAPFEFEEIHIQCSASIGAITHSLAEDSITYSELFRKADVALYKAKFQGKDKTQIVEKSPGTSQKLTFNTASKIQKALKNNEFQVFYQPKVNVHNQTIFGSEALVRWFPHNNLPIAPNDFIPAAELSGDIIDIGNWVFEATCAQIKYWRDKKNISLPVAVNMSPVQIGHEETITFIKKTLEKYDLSPELLEIEVTETTSLFNSKILIDHLSEIHKLGCPITIDDFGIGYSSLERFLDFPISSLKIDRKFIERINQSSKAHSVCKSIVDLASYLDIPVTAEGVETFSQMTAVKNLNCQYAQGFFIKEPVPSDVFLSWSKNYPSV